MQNYTIKISAKGIYYKSNSQNNVGLLTSTKKKKKIEISLII